jgi:hypothetical protein
MKRIAVVILIFAALAACSKKKTSNAGYSVQPGSGKDTLVGLSAKVNGTDWIADSVHGYRVKYATDSGKADLLVTAFRRENGVASTITFTLTNYTGTGTYIVAPPFISAAYYLGNVRKFATSGQINVDSDNEYGIVGTFNFTSDTAFAVTEGIFNVAQP